MKICLVNGPQHGKVIEDFPNHQTLYPAWQIVDGGLAPDGIPITNHQEVGTYVGQKGSDGEIVYFVFTEEILRS